MYTRRLADVYDALHHFVDYPKNAAFIIDILNRYHPTARSLLETACGTGKYLEIFQEHYSVQGLDLSGEMLVKAAERLPGVPLYEASMVDFQLPQQFDVVCCLFRSISCVKTEEDFFATVQCMARHIRPGGVLLIEPFFTPENFWTDTVTLNDYKSDALKVVWMYTSKRKDGFAELDCHYLVGTPDRVDHFTEVHQLGLFTPVQYEKAFAAAGLQLHFNGAGPTAVGLYIGQKRLEIR